VQQLAVPPNKAVQIVGVRARGEVSGFQLFYNDHTTNGWSSLGPRAFLGEGFWSPLLGVDPRLNAKPYEWYLGIDQITVNAGAAGIVANIEINNPDKVTIHIIDQGNENTTIVFNFV